MTNVNQTPEIEAAQVAERVSFLQHQKLSAAVEVGAVEADPLIQGASQPVYADADGSAINLLVVFRGIGAVPFTASPHDTTQHGRDLFTRAVAGEFGVIAPYVAPVVPAPAPLTRAQDASRIIAAVLAPNKRASLNLYATRIALTAVKDRTEEQKADIITIIALDDWEEAVLAAIDDPAAPWPEPPTGAADLVAAC